MTTHPDIGFAAKTNESYSHSLKYFWKDTPYKLVVEEAKAKYEKINEEAGCMYKKKEEDMIRKFKTFGDKNGFVKRSYFRYRL